MIHELKIAPKYFEDVISGKKTFEIRKNDRKFRVGDLLALNEYIIERNIYTGNSCLVYVDYVLDDIEYAKAGFIIMSIKPCCVGRRDEHYITDVKLYSVPLATREKDYDASEEDNEGECEDK